LVRESIDEALEVGATRRVAAPAEDTAEGAQFGQRQPPERIGRQA
jgi:hypothetical protein